MEASADDLPKNDIFQIPLIDLRGFCQDELNMAARLSGDIPEPTLSGMASPKIDKSIFNESAGSRRQTYSGCRVSRKRKEPVLESDAREASQGILMSSIMKYSTRRKSGSIKKSGKNILDLVDKLLHIADKKDESQINVSNSLSSIMSEETNVLNLAYINEHQNEDKSQEVLDARPHMQKVINTQIVLTRVSELQGEIWRMRSSVKNVQGLQEYQNDIVVNVSTPETSNTPEVLKGDPEEAGNLSENLEGLHEDQIKAIDDATPCTRSHQHSHSIRRSLRNKESGTGHSEAVGKIRRAT